MSQSTAKAVRRELRRSVGVEGVAIIVQLQKNVEALTNSLTLAHKRIDGLEAQLKLGGGVNELTR